MYKTVAEARHLVSELVPGLQTVEGVEKVICPPFTALLAVAALLEGTDIRLGAQNLFWEPSGAYTGEISPPMIAELCQYVILGHAERRIYFGETDETVNRKVEAALAHGLCPIVCVGETLEENQGGLTAQVVSQQVLGGLSGLGVLGGSSEDHAKVLVISYQPGWAIGTERAAAAEDANSISAEVIRPALAEIFGAETAQALRVIYGGSVKSSNAAEFFHQPEIDGVLVDESSFKASEFLAIVQAAIR
jgi:triosephosphate isomerase